MEALIVSTYLLMRTNPFYCLAMTGLLMLTPPASAQKPR